MMVVRTEKMREGAGLDWLFRGLDYDGVTHDGWMTHGPGSVLCN